MEDKDKYEPGVRIILDQLDHLGNGNVEMLEELKKWIKENLELREGKRH